MLVRPSCLCCLFVSLATCSLPAHRLTPGDTPSIESIRTYSITYKEVPLVSETICAATASQETSLYNVVCYNEALKTCQMAELNVSLPADPSNADWKCWKSILCIHPVSGPLLDGVMEKDVICPDTFNVECTDQGLQARVNKRGPPPPGFFPLTCELPFILTPIGCLFADPSAQTFCDGRMSCLMKGGDLISLDTSADFTAFMDYMTTTYGNGEVFWIGLTNSDGLYRWVSNGRPSPPEEWQPGEPNDGAGARCVRTKEFMHLMADVPCWLNLRPLCERRL